ncbi:MAG: hypothetical protein JSS68_16450 [Actinobacteria bacterium]|nr:hypothetical protein [Actinomycetota bacterium]
MPPNPKSKALDAARRAQADFEKTQEQLERHVHTRRESFERAKAAGATLREIGEVVGLHHTRVGQIVRGE